MIEKSYFVVGWARGNAAGESRRFEDWDSAKDFFEELIADPKTHSARLLDVTEREVRSFEHEVVSASRL